jgi:hypothetical protein
MRSRAMSDRLLYLSLIVGVLVAAALVGKAVHDYRNFRTLNDDGRSASAIVRELEPAHSRRGRAGRWTLHFSFKTPDSETIDAAVGIPRHLAERLRIGQSIDVVYAPGDPSLAALDSEQAWAVVVYNERLLVPYMALLMVLAWNALERYRAKRP